MIQKESGWDWIKRALDTVYQFYHGREIVLWGKYIVSDDIRNKLKEIYHIDTVFYVDSNPDKVDNRQVFPTEILSGKSGQYYVIIPLPVYQSIEDILYEGGYKPNLDYFYFDDCVLYEEDDYYEDAHGNKIIGNRRGVKFTFSGFNSVIEIGDNTKFKKLEICIHNNSKIIIGRNTVIRKTNIRVGECSKINIGYNTEFLMGNISIGNEAVYEADRECSFQCFSISIGNYAKTLIGREVALMGTNEHGANWFVNDRANLEIGDRGRFKYGVLYLKSQSLLKIGKEFTVEEDCHICSDGGTSVLIGDDCMFSTEISVESNDGHSIFDITTGKNVNSSYDICKSRKVMIGNHVWVGRRCIILSNARIADGCVIGTMSMVKCKVPNNCIAAGIPARILRENIAWSREYGSVDIMSCGQEYVNLTKEKET